MNSARDLAGKTTLVSTGWRGEFAGLEISLTHHEAQDWTWRVHDPRTKRNAYGSMRTELGAKLMIVNALDAFEAEP